MHPLPTVPFETTLAVRDCCLCLHVQRAARALARRFDEALRPFDLTNGQFSLLMSLNRPKPPAMGAVASLLAMDRTTLTAALKPLERRGLVKVTADPLDWRSRLMKLTANGRACWRAPCQSGSARTGRWKAFLRMEIPRGCGTIYARCLSTCATPG
jgi:DNA-binding MarR family transcriptional regulator